MSDSINTPATARSFRLDSSLFLIQQPVTPSTITQHLSSSEYHSNFHIAVFRFFPSVYPQEFFLNGIYHERWITGKLFFAILEQISASSTAVLPSHRFRYILITIEKTIASSRKQDPPIAPWFLFSLSPRPNIEHLRRWDNQGITSNKHRCRLPRRKGRFSKSTLLTWSKNNFCSKRSTNAYAYDSINSWNLARLSHLPVYYQRQLLSSTDHTHFAYR